MATKGRGLAEERRGCDVVDRAAEEQLWARHEDEQQRHSQASEAGDAEEGAGRVPAEASLPCVYLVSV